MQSSCPVQSSCLVIMQAALPACRCTLVGSCAGPFRRIGRSIFSRFLHETLVGDGVECPASVTTVKYEYSVQSRMNKAPRNTNPKTLPNYLLLHVQRCESLMYNHPDYSPAHYIYYSSVEANRYKVSSDTLPPKPPHQNPYIILHLRP